MALAHSVYLEGRSIHFSHGDSCAANRGRLAVSPSYTWLACMTIANAATASTAGHGDATQAIPLQHSHRAFLVAAKDLCHALTEFASNARLSSWLLLHGVSVSLQHLQAVHVSSDTGAHGAPGWGGGDAQGGGGLERRRPLALEERDSGGDDDVDNGPEAEVPGEGDGADGGGGGSRPEVAVAEVGVVEGEEDGDGGKVAEVHADGLTRGRIPDVAAREQRERPAVDCDVLHARREPRDAGGNEPGVEVMEQIGSSWS